MALRCVLFSTDPGTVEPIRQALADLGVEGEHCTEAVTAVDKVCRESFQILIVDWDKQPEAGTLLTAARERKISERPLTLAIVSDDAGAPKAMQAGANSILRKPVVAKQVTDSLSRARDLLRARESAAQAAAAGVGASPVPSVTAGAPSTESTLRAGEFLQSAAPASQIDTESEMQKSLDQSEAQEVKALKDLEPTASAVVPQSAPPPSPDEPRGLQWYLNRAQAAAPAPAPAAAPSQPAAPVQSRPELLGYDQLHSQTSQANSDDLAQARPPKEVAPKEDDKKAAAELFAYIAGEGEKPEKTDRPRMRLGKGPILVASALAACAIVAAPQAPWHPQILKLWGRGQLATHAWLNPQLVTPAQAPASHESFGRPGDEYKLPVAETIPDATTDPSQIRVTPMVDPTAKKPNAGANADPNLAPSDSGGTTVDPAQSPGMSTVTPNSPAANSPNASPSPANGDGGSPGSNNTTAPSPTQTAVPGNSGTGAPASVAAPPPTVTPAPAAAPETTPSVPPPAATKNPQPRPATTTSGPPIPSSLRSQMASMTPDASGNKAPETALPSIEPVAVTETAERALVTDQPAPAYPANVNGQQGTVVLQVLVGRDGTVQDAKFLQGALAFARAAIDGVKQWKFKPYIMNGRPVSIQTNLTISFRPGQ